jgi:hypothetical protein
VGAVAERQPRRALVTPAPWGGPEAVRISRARSHGTRDGQTVNAVVAFGTATFLVVTASGLYDLQSWLERSDYQRHFED